jgi:hypothetical protein
MKKMTGFLAVLIMLMASNTIRADANSLVNGSFEADGYIDNITDDITDPNTLTGWDVNVPEQFDGWVGDYWVTDGDYSLTLHSKPGAFEVDDIAYVWQDVYLSDVNQIFFDVHLDTSGEDWNPALRSAVVMIDDTVVWESPKTGTDIRGEYLNQAINVSSEDWGLHRFAIGIMADVNEPQTSIEYYTDWDNIRLGVSSCSEYLPGDFNKDCVVDVNDLAMLADVWLDEVAIDSIYNLSSAGDDEETGIVNFADFAVFADYWLENSFE